MAALVKCAKGHWYQPDPSGKPTACPRCEAQLHPKKDTPISEDDVLAFLDDGPSPNPDSSSSSSRGLTGSGDSHQTLLRRKKVCPKCHYEASVSFGHCPRCGGPLEIAKTEVF